MRRVNKITRKINKIETNNDLFEITEEGPIWDYIRLELWEQLRNVLNESQGKQSNQTNTDYSAIVKEIIKHFINNNPLILENKDILFHGFSRRVADENEQYRCIHCDPIIEYVNSSSTVIENPNLHPVLPNYGNRCN